MIIIMLVRSLPLTMNLSMKPVEDECIYKVTRNEDVT